MRRQARFFLVAGGAALALRLFFVFRFPAVIDDSRLYGNIAENWLQHGVYAITNSGKIMPTLSRLPGYPAFLAAIFSIFGMRNFRAVLLIQVLFDLGTCLLIADLARRLFSERTARAAFLLAGLCPFLANYAATALTETLEIFFTTLAFCFALAALNIGEMPKPAAWRNWMWLRCGLAIAAAILLRPDGGIVLASVVGYLVLLYLRSRSMERLPPVFYRRSLVVAGLLVAIGALAPLIPWTLRNFRTFHRFEPLAPRYANDSDEPLMPGFNRWAKTWLAEYVSVEEIYWNVPGEEIDLSRLPNRAFDSPEQRHETADLFADYNRDHDMSPELDARFAALAASRIHRSPLRYYLWLPMIRITDMWLRPRTELFPSDPRWWEFNDDPVWLGASLALGVLNFLYVAGAGAGWVLRGRTTCGMGMFLLFVLLRSGFLGTLENPEPRYTLECYPAAILFCSALFANTRK